MAPKPILAALVILLTSSCGQEVTYLDDDFPGKTPKLYAPGMINVAGRLQQNLSMSADGNEHYFTITDSTLWRYERILRIVRTSNGIEVDTPQFVKDFEYQNEWFIGEPMLSPDNEYLYFVADYPPDLWRSKRTATNDWGSPAKLTGISTEKDD